MSVKKLSQRLRQMAREEAAATTPARRYFRVTGVDPVTVADTATGDEWDEDEEGFDLSGYAAFYHANVGLEEGDLLLCHPVDAEDGEPIWVATSVTTDNDHPIIPPPAP